MKTITEFSGFALKDAAAKKTALLTEGKTEEEAQAALNEQLKLSDDTKIAFYKNAVDMTNSRKDQVKRVVIATKASETEKVPENFMEREGHFYLVEYFPQAGSAHRSSGRDDDFRGGDRGRGGRGGSGGGGRGRGGNDRGGSSGDRPYSDRPAFGGGNDRPAYSDRPARVAPARDPSIPRPEGQFAKLDPNAVPAPRPARPPREKRPAGPREPRPPREPRGPKGAGELRLVLKGQSATTLQGSGPAEAAASEAISPENQSTPSPQA
jgi:hypothetical protein